MAVISHTATLQEMIATTHRGGCEVTLNSLFNALEAEGLALDQLEVAKDFLDKWAFDLFPPISTGDFDTPRILKPRDLPTITQELAMQEISRGESSTLELKASLLYDYNRAEAVPNTPIQQLKSNDVLYSSLKTIAAFLNSEGGTLYIGVSNDLKPLGLVNDCILFGLESFDKDAWELEFRNHLTGKFKDGKAINDYVTTSFIPLDQVCVARVQVFERSRLAFIQENIGPRLYRRQGNRTAEVSIDEVEEYLLYRASARQSPRK